MAAARKMFGVTTRGKVLCKIVAGSCGPYSTPPRISFWFADADVWTDQPWPGKRVFASGDSLAAALRALADEIDANQRGGT